MSSYVNSHIHFRTIHKSLTLWLKLNQRDYKTYFERRMESLGIDTYGVIDKKPETVAEICWVIVMHMIELQVACVTVQYNDHNKAEKSLHDYVNTETVGLITEAKNQDRCPSYEYPHFHKVLRGYMYQVEIEGLDNLHEKYDKDVARYKAIYEFVEWMIGIMNDKYISSRPGYDDAPWGVYEEHLLKNGDVEPVFLTDLM